MANKRTLYECFNARVKDSIIYCAKGHPFTKLNHHGTIGINRLYRGEPLIYQVCQGCIDFDSMGDPIPPKEKGGGFSRRNQNKAQAGDLSIPSGRKPACAAL